MCSKAYLIFPATLIDLMTDITFFLQFSPFLISLGLTCTCLHPPSCAGRIINWRTTGMGMTKLHWTFCCLLTWLPSTGQQRNNNLSSFARKKLMVLPWSRCLGWFSLLCHLEALARSVMCMSWTRKSSAPPRCAGGISYVFAEDFKGSHERGRELK